MTKTQPALSIDAEIWEKFKSRGKNASAEIEQFMAEILQDQGLVDKTPEEIRNERDELKKQQEEARKQQEIEAQKAYARGDFTALIPNGSVFDVRKLF